ncbi:MAG: DUF362 domain-containing protein [Candidatus Korarchaeota archaeon]
MSSRRKQAVTKRSTVAVVRADNPKDGVREAIKQLGGMSRFVRRDQTVLIKPDHSLPFPPPAITDPDVVATLILLAYESGAKRVIVGDTPMYGLKGSTIFKYLGLDDYYEAYGAVVMPFDEVPHIPSEIGGGRIMKVARIPEILREVDVIISAPVAKTDILTKVSLGIKNNHGFLLLEEQLLHHRREFHQKLVDILKLVTPHLTLIDMGIVMEGNGPVIGKPEKVGLYVASTDVVAADATAALIMGYDPEDVPHIRLAHEQGLGVADMNFIDYIGERPRDVRHVVLKPTTNLEEDVCKGLFIYTTPPVCPGCFMPVRLLIDFANTLMKKDFEEYGNVSILAGTDPPYPIDAPDNVVVVGDCAIESTKEWYTAALTQPWKREKRWKIAPGCPPPIALRFKLIYDVLREQGFYSPMFTVIADLIDMMAQREVPFRSLFFYRKSAVSEAAQKEKYLARLEQEEMRLLGEAKAAQSKGDTKKAAKLYYRVAEINERIGAKTVAEKYLKMAKMLESGLGAGTTLQVRQLEKLNAKRKELIDLASQAATKKDYTTAIEYYHAAAEISRQLGDTEIAAILEKRALTLQHELERESYSSGAKGGVK